MGVYIKGMEMPKSCGYCPLRNEGDECSLGALLTEYQKRPDDCPLAPVPPHGPLIDMNDFLSEWPELESYRTAMRLCEVLPAEEGE